MDQTPRPRTPRDMLDHAKPYEQWAAHLTPRQYRSLEVLGETPRSFYDRLMKSLHAQISAPTPTTFLATNDGKTT